MKRLWVRLSLVISGLILFFSILPLFTFLFLPEPPPRDNPPPPNPPAVTTAQAAAPVDSQTDRPPPKPQEDHHFFSPWRDLPENLLSAFLLASVAGIAGGVMASWFLVSPIAKLAHAAHAVGAGNLAARVEIPNSSQEIDELAQAFNTMAADLQRAAEVRNNLMADVSHELRTPLTVLEGNLRAALDHVIELDEEQVANLYQQTHHLIHLVNELRELTLAEAAQLPLDMQPVDLGQLVQETVAIFVPLAEEQNVSLKTQLPNRLPSVNVDRVRMRQVLHNLLANALRHTPADGAITITANIRRDGVRLSIADSGEGIAPEHLEHVFERFYRTDPSRSRETGGSGLGLAIVKAIVEAHRGSITAASAGLGKGSVFHIELPV